MSNEFGMKELYEVRIKTTLPMEFNGRQISAGETIAYFDSIQIAGFEDITKVWKATGGWDNRGLIYWENTSDIRITLAQGIFSKEQLAVMSNAKLIKENNSSIILTQREVVESDQNGNIELKYNPTGDIFIYNTSTGNKISYTVVENNILNINSEYTEVMVDYQFTYTKPFQELLVGHALTSGFVELEGRIRIKDDITGQTHSGILRIPRLKLMSDISIRLGRNAQPLVSTLQGMATPIGDRNNKRIMEILFLDDDIDSDM